MITRKRRALISKSINAKKSFLPIPTKETVTLSLTHNEYLSQIQHHKTNLSQVSNSIIKNWDIEELISHMEEVDSHSLTTSCQKRYYLMGSYMGEYLTLREAQCLVLHLKGLSAKMIGRNLHISHRTVEFYLDKIKRKLNCQKLRELMYRLSLIEKH